ncbi:DUF4352 domain-containing protein [Streptomyces sp. NBC_01808]|uniref:hypothetical protein n=1 Tax=Streptomyces sp. NBC_01808 TaxID=2975947 RepID=UPI002DDA5E0E|nr:hypothetical protein [Streptomyces sp. NBC_01808]WSA38448.1 DUF4352 domain-containing protein [Streptomyces sp. NBC_01808]
MHRTIVSTAAAVALATVLTACGGSDLSVGDDGADVESSQGPDAAADAGAVPSDTEQTPTAAPSSTEPFGAKVGDTLSLSGAAGLGGSGQVQSDTTLNAYEDDAEPAMATFGAGPGQRLVAAEFTILSTGDTAYDDPGNIGAQVVDADGNAYAAKPGDPTAGTSLPLNLYLPPGEEATGWMIFDVPEDAEITSVTYQMDPLLQPDDKQNRGTWTVLD